MRAPHAALAPAGIGRLPEIDGSGTRRRPRGAQRRSTRHAIPFKTLGPPAGRIASSDRRGPPGNAIRQARPGKRRAGVDQQQKGGGAWLTCKAGTAKPHPCVSTPWCRRRGRRPVPAPSAARAGPAGPGVRSRVRRRRHLVLEPLPRRALRLRGLHLPVPVLRGALQRLELEREVPGPAGDRTLAALRRRPARSAKDIQFDTTDHERAVRRGDGTLDGSRPIRRDDRHPVPGHLLRHAVGPADQVLRRAGDFPGSWSTPRAGRRTGSTSPASASAWSASAPPASRSSRPSPTRSGT